MLSDERRLLEVLYLRRRLQGPTLAAFELADLEARIVALEARLGIQHALPWEAGDDVAVAEG